MDTCKPCGKDMERESTHWEGCHADHPECAAYREGFRAGMRAAAEIVAKQRMTVAGHMKPYEPIDAINAELLLEDCADACDEIAKAILAEADK